MSADKYIQQLASNYLQEVIKANIEKVAISAKACRETNYCRLPSVHPMKEVDYLILGNDSRDKIVNYIYRGIIRDPHSKNMIAKSYTIYYIDQFGNLHSVIYNDVKNYPNIPRRVTYNVNHDDGSTKIKSSIAVDFIRKYTTPLYGEILYSKTIHCDDNESSTSHDDNCKDRNAYIALEAGTADANDIGKLLYNSMCMWTGKVINISDINFLDNKIQIESIDLLYQVFCDVIDMSNKVYLDTKRSQNNEINIKNLYQLCAIETAQISLNKSRNILTLQAIQQIQMCEDMQKATNHIVDQMTIQLRESAQKCQEDLFKQQQQLDEKVAESDKKADELLAMTAELHQRSTELDQRSTELDKQEHILDIEKEVLNDSRDHFDIQVALNSRDFDKRVAERVALETLSIHRDLEARELTVTHKLAAVAAANLALDIKKNIIEECEKNNALRLSDANESMAERRRALSDKEREISDREDDINMTIADLENRKAELMDRKNCADDIERTLNQKKSELDMREEKLFNDIQIAALKEEALKEHEDEVYSREEYCDTLYRNLSKDFATHANIEEFNLMLYKTEQLIAEFQCKFWTLYDDIDRVNKESVIDVLRKSNISMMTDIMNVRTKLRNITKIFNHRIPTFNEFSDINIPLA